MQVNSQISALQLSLFEFLTNFQNFPPPEILMVNTETGDLLPFGTLGIHKKGNFRSAEVCLFIFDCVYYNGLDLTKKKMKERKKFLEDTIKPIKNHIEMSEYKLLKSKNDLISMIQEVLQKGLEG